jgi:protein-S-isoprenylcysteine O-methyltransferase Ste14
MQRILKIFTLISLVYVLPLTLNISLVTDLRIIILALAGAVMLLTQPDISAEEASNKRDTDRFSVIFILVAGFLSQVIPVVEWAYFKNADNQFVTMLGFIMIVSGLSFRIWAIRTLGRFFTSTVQIVEGHRVIKTGPYALVRHPSYTGAYISMVGSAVFLNAPIGIIGAVILMAIAYRMRIKTEEKALIEEFGQEYIEYIRTTPGFIPFLSLRKGIALD